MTPCTASPSASSTAMRLHVGDPGVLVQRVLGLVGGVALSMVRAVDFDQPHPVLVRHQEVGLPGAAWHSHRGVGHDANRFVGRQRLTTSMRDFAIAAARAVRSHGHRLGHGHCHR